ncbi:MAG TPA: hypothetical protein V6C72_12645, partial [Chroococcales cyanobacterium]
MTASFDALVGETNSNANNGGDKTGLQQNQQHPTDTTTTTTAAAQSNSTDATHLEGGGGGGTTGSTDKLTDEGLLCWTKDLANECKSAWSTVTSFFESPTAQKSAQKVDNIDSLTFDSVYPTTTASTTPVSGGSATGDAQATTTAAKTTTDNSGGGGGGVSGFFSDLTKEVSSAVSNPLDWLFQSHDSAGDTATVAAKNGVATFNGTKDGDNVNVGATKTTVAGTAGDMQFTQNKETKQTTLNEGGFLLNAGPDGTSATNTSTGEKVSVDPSTGN